MRLKVFFAAHVVEIQWKVYKLIVWLSTIFCFHWNCVFYFVDDQLKFCVIVWSAPKDYNLISGNFYEWILIFVILKLLKGFEIIFWIFRVLKFVNFPVICRVFKYSNVRMNCKVFSFKHLYGFESFVGFLRNHFSKKNCKVQNFKHLYGFR